MSISTMHLKKITDILMSICSYAPSLGIVPKPKKYNRKEGISALILLRNEPWIEPSILSIKDTVDEYVIIDCSTDDTPKKIERIKNQENLNLKYVHMEPNIYKQLEMAIKLSSREWLLRWDGDFIAYKSGRRSIKKIKDIIKSLSKCKYYFIEFSVLNVELDLLHIEKNPHHKEAYLFKYSPSLKKLSFLRKLRNVLRSKITRRFPPRAPYLPFPFWYKRIVLDKTFAMHLKTVKSPLKLLERKYQTHWGLLSSKEKQLFANSFNEYIKYYVKKEFKTEDIKEASLIYVNNMIRNKKLLTYNPDVWGNYPEILNKYIKNKIGVNIINNNDFKNKFTDFLSK